MFFVILIFPLILSSIFPSVYSFPMHVIIQPITFIFLQINNNIYSAISPTVNSSTTNFIIRPISFIGRCIVPNILAMPMLFPLFVISVIFRPIRPSFYSPTILEIIFPLTFIFCSIHMNIDS